jgi:hypothetical protein
VESGDYNNLFAREYRDAIRHLLTRPRAASGGSAAAAGAALVGAAEEAGDVAVVAEDEADGAAGALDAFVEQGEQAVSEVELDALLLAFVARELSVERLETGGSREEQKPGERLSTRPQSQG